MSKIELYVAEDGAPGLSVRFDEESLWLTQGQIADLFDTSQQNISLHLRNIYEEGELAVSATYKDYLSVQKEGSREVRRKVAHYNLDAILSVGYRVKSATATKFRIWATARLHELLVQGYTLNERRLEELGQVVSILSRSSDQLASGIAEVVSAYLPGLVLLHDYDEGTVKIAPKSVPMWELTLAEARRIIAAVAAEFPQDTLAGRERGNALEAIVAAVYQGFGGQDVYPTVEEKAAHLLYFVVKDHPLSDGNKRSAAALFVSFLVSNNLLYSANGTPRITNNALAAITLLVASSDPREKELMIALIIKMLEAD